MTQPNDQTIQLSAEDQASGVCQNMLEETLRQGAQWLLAKAIEQEVEDYLEKHAQARDERGHRLVVRNGRLRQRTLQSGIGPIQVKAPRVDDLREGRRFSSAILPPYLRKVPSLENLIPTLYLDRRLDLRHGTGAGSDSRPRGETRVAPSQFADHRIGHLPETIMKRLRAEE